jgi:hypothetical protein
MATRYWTGLGTNGNWSTSANWSGQAVPTSSDSVIIDKTAAITIASQSRCNDLTIGTSTQITVTIDSPKRGDNYVDTYKLEVWGHFTVGPNTNTVLNMKFMTLVFK